MSLSLSLSLSNGGMNRKCLCFINGLGAVGMLATAGLKASDGAEVDHGREWNPYVTVRGGWLFGKAKYNDYVTFGNTVGHSIKKSIKVVFQIYISHLHVIIIFNFRISQIMNIYSI